MKHGENLKGPDGDKGRSLGGKARAAAYNVMPAPADCHHCAQMGYETMAQHNGHLGFRALMMDRPEALHSIREKVARTGRESSRTRWKAVGR